MSVHVLVKSLRTMSENYGRGYVATLAKMQSVDPETPQLQTLQAVMTDTFLEGIIEFLMLSAKLNLKSVELPETTGNALEDLTALLYLHQDRKPDAQTN